jgi:hypothetical protein
MKLQNLIHIVIGIVCVGLLSNARPVAAQSRAVDGAPLASPGNVQEAWVARYNGPLNFDDEARAIAIDGAGNSYVTGWSAGYGTGYDYTTIKYNPAGQEEWVACRDGHVEPDVPSAIAVDGSGNVYVTGSHATTCLYSAVSAAVISAPGRTPL